MHLVLPGELSAQVSGLSAQIQDCFVTFTFVCKLMDQKANKRLSSNFFRKNPTVAIKTIAVGKDAICD